MGGKAGLVNDSKPQPLLCLSVAQDARGLEVESSCFVGNWGIVMGFSLSVQ